MSSLRFARAALRARPAAIRLPLGRRTYADAVADKIKLSLAMPHQVRPDFCPMDKDEDFYLIGMNIQY